MCVIIDKFVPAGGYNFVLIVDPGLGISPSVILAGPPRMTLTAKLVIMYGKLSVWIAAHMRGGKDTWTTSRGFRAGSCPTREADVPYMPLFSMQAPKAAS